MARIDKGRFGRAVAYLEVDLLLPLNEQAVEEGETVSSWLRKLIMQKLLDKGKINQETVLKLAS